MDGWVWMDGLGWKSLCGATLEHRFAMLKMVQNISRNIIMIKGPMNRRCGWALESAEAEVNTGSCDFIFIAHCGVCYLLVCTSCTSYGFIFITHCNGLYKDECALISHCYLRNNHRHRQCSYFTEPQCST